MEEIIKELKERGFVKQLQRGINVCSKLGNDDKEGQLFASKKTLVMYIERLKEDDELLDKFLDFAVDVAAESIIKALDLKADENYEVSKGEEALVSLTKLLKSIMEDK